MKNYFSEFLSTFMLVFVGTGCLIVNEQFNGVLGLPGIATCWGLVIIATVYSFGDISGNHINPAVTLAFAIDKRFDWKNVPGFIISQLSGALFASWLLHILFPYNQKLGITLPSGQPFQAFIVEAIMTFVLLMVVLRVSTGSKEKGFTAGIVIGCTVWFLVLFGGPVSGTSLNPTRSLAPAIISGNFQNLWIYLTAPFLGAISAVYAHKLLH